MNEEEIYRKAVDLVANARGKLEVTNKVGANNLEELSIAYTPGVAEPTRAVHADKSLQYQYTAKASMLAIVTDGTAVLGLGNVGPEAAMVVMEGKGVMLKHFANADPVPLCLSTTDVDEIVKTVKNVEPSFGFFFLEDIAAPRCFEIEERLNRELNVPVFHDDQHGTAMAICAGLKNVARLSGCDLSSKRVVISGAGASAIATANLLFELGIDKITMFDSKGALSKNRNDLNKYKQSVVDRSSVALEGNLADAFKGADIFIGLSRAGLVSKEMVASMNPDATIFALANPDPEIFPPDAIEAGARYIGTGRFDFPNTVNNLLAFPGIVKGAMRSRAAHITLAMKLAAIDAIANYVTDDKLSETYLLPNPLDMNLSDSVATAIAAVADS
ncbi:NADP-dependent malic enzyme [Oceanidesulfovibrio marinus]|uniref:NAD-dependent malic enzyme n=1 Tax=Oceanidesulfovibrio marinus TaxID=370038 RepID=A0A6P1ZQN8_9BACT|nr:NADP-dependent malic enzyme [Oceanidesulfovibrio marinus]QJT08785.1 NADP-dependent malic enzyme [Oceanidesulfovibrio marinus]TVM36787.1 NAD-dependent malic enzyme [Oceanidesulfovibrio marinus]